MLPFSPATLYNPENGLDGLLTGSTFISSNAIRPRSRSPGGGDVRFDFNKNRKAT